MHLNHLVVHSAVHAFIIQSLICAAQNISEVLETIVKDPLPIFRYVFVSALVGAHTW